MRAFYAVIGLLLLSFSAHAIPVRWQLPPPDSVTAVSGVTDAFGPQIFVLEGSFVYDADTNVYSNIEIARSGANFTLTNTSCYFGCSDQTGLTFGFIGEYDFDTGSQVEEYYRLAFNVPLTNAGGAVSLMFPGSQFIDCDALEGCGGLSDVRGWLGILGGEAAIVGSVIPIPAAAWLFGSALAGLGWLRRIQRK